ncbi:hypothetical protein O4O02_19890 [Pseudomonas fortuita]|uniref:hypothetical protein n=1 Tax=Pseudomonas fortuita TaxID=3233375 RepID=UPI003D81A22E
MQHPARLKLFAKQAPHGLFQTRAKLQLACNDAGINSDTSDAKAALVIQSHLYAVRAGLNSSAFDWVPNGLISLIVGLTWASGGDHLHLSVDPTIALVQLKSDMVVDLPAGHTRQIVGALHWFAPETKVLTKVANRKKVTLGTSLALPNYAPRGIITTSTTQGDGGAKQAVDQGA